MDFCSRVCNHCSSSSSKYPCEEVWCVNYTINTDALRDEAGRITRNARCNGIVYSSEWDSAAYRFEYNNGPDPGPIPIVVEGSVVLEESLTGRYESVYTQLVKMFGEVPTVRYMRVCQNTNSWLQNMTSRKIEYVGVKLHSDKTLQLLHRPETIKDDCLLYIRLDETLGQVLPQLLHDGRAANVEDFSYIPRGKDRVSRQPVDGHWSVREWVQRAGTLAIGHRSLFYRN